MQLVNIGTKGRTVYLFLRDSSGKLKIKTIKDFQPYYYEPVETGATHKSFTGQPVKKIYASSDKEIYQNKSNRALEADIKLPKRYLIDQIQTIEPTNLKWSMIDIELQTFEDESFPNPFTTTNTITSITAYNSFKQEYKTYFLPDYESEEDMLKMFVWYLANEKFDILFFWNAYGFDYPLLCNKIEYFPNKISPINESRWGFRQDDYKVFFPIGTSIIDYMEWDKKYTLNRRKSYALDAVLEDEFGKGKEIKDVDWSIISEEVKKRNINDVKDMVKLEEKNNLISYYDNIRRTTYTQWEDLIYNSRMIDTLVLREAKKRNVVMPSKPDELPKDDFKSKVLRKTFDTGLFKDCISVDLSSAYPHTIIDFNLDPSNLVTGITPTSLELAGANFEQNAGAIFPTVAKKLITIKTEIANERDSYPVDSKEYKEKKVAYSAIKGIVNSIFGVFGDKRTRLYNKDIARAITRLPKEMLLYCLDKLEKLNIFPLYADTDGIILNTEENITEMLNAFIKKWAKEKFGTDKEISTTFDCEGIWKSILILKRCRYHGFLQHTNGEIEEKNVGLESKRKDSSKFIKKFQKELVQKIHNGISKEEVIKWVKKEKENIRTAPLEDIAFPCKLSKPIEDYDSRSIWVRAYEYANELYGYKVRIGQPYYYIYVESGEYEDKIVELEMINGSKLTNSKLKNYWCEYFGVPHILVKNMDKEKLKELKDNLKEKGIIYIEKGEMRGRKKDVIAFDEKNKEHMKHYEINWKKMIERNIDNKSEVIFGALDWLDTE